MDIEEVVHTKDEVGVVHGRFQVLHLKHIEYILAAKMRCKKLYIGITSPDTLRGGDSVNEPELATHEANPLTYFERFEILKGAMDEFGLEEKDYDILPFPINQPELLTQYVPKDATYYMGMCSAWDEEKLKILKGLGLKTEILWKREGEEVGTTGTLVRHRIAEGEPWKDLVPKYAYRYITEHGIDERIKKLEQMRIDEKKVL